MSDIFDVSGRVAVVTGAGGGLGTAICAGLATHGADVALIDVNRETLEASAAGVRAQGRRALVLERDASTRPRSRRLSPRSTRRSGRWTSSSTSPTRRSSRRPRI